MDAKVDYRRADRGQAQRRSASTPAASARQRRRERASDALRSRALLVAAALAGVLGWRPARPGTPFGADKPKPKPTASRSSPRSARAPVWNAEHRRRRSSRSSSARQRRRRHAGRRATAPWSPLEAASGRALWRANVGAKLSAGVGSDGKLAAVVTRDNELVALEGGKVKWRKALGVRGRDRAAGGRRARLRAGRRPRRAGLRRARRPPSSGSCSGPAIR